jgi:hypothetical protein
MMKKYIIITALTVASLYGQVQPYPPSGNATSVGGVPVPAGQSLAPVFNVVGYGAKCDGTTDDSSAIQSAVTAATAVNGQVLIPSSASGCVLRSKALIPLNIQFVGQGSSGGSKILCTNAALNYCFVIAGNSSTNNVQGQAFRDIQIVGPSSGTNTALFLGGDPTGTAAPSTYQGNHLAINNVQISGFSNAVVFGNNAYIIDFNQPDIHDNTIGFSVLSQAVANSGEHINFIGGKIAGGTNLFSMQFGGGGVANPGGANFELYFDGTSLDYPTGSMITGPRITAHFVHAHLEANTTPFINCNEPSSGKGVCQIDFTGSTIALIGLAAPIGTDAVFFSNVFFSNFSLPDGNYVYLSRTQSFLVDWAVSTSSPLATLNIGYPWGFDTNFSSFTPPLSNAASPSFIPRNRGVAILQGPNGTQGHFGYINCDFGDCHWTNSDGKITADLGDTNGFDAFCVRNSAFATVGCINTQGILYSQTGGTLASAGTIAPVAGITHITGTAAIATITLPPNFSGTLGGCITLIADAAWTTTTAGNIQSAMAAVANTPYQACYGGSKWYIK